MSKEKIKILRCLDSGHYNNVTYPGMSPNIQRHINELFATGYIRKADEGLYYVLTSKAYEVIDKYDSLCELRRKDDVKYWITTAIALAAFVKSFFF